MTDRSAASRRARGLKRLDAWLSARTIQRLDELAEDSGYSRAAMVEAMIDAEWEEWKAIVEPP